MALFLVIVGLLTIIGVLVIGVIETRRPKRNDIKEDINLKKPKKRVKFSDEVIAQLKKMGELKEKGVLTEEEFQRQKAKLLSHQT